MITRVLWFLCFAASFSLAAPQTVPLWKNAAPDAKGQRPEDTPTLTVYPANPADSTGTAIVICPGGGYAKLAPHEGEGYARWLNAHGIHAFVLKYRLGSSGYRHPAMLDDAARAVRLVRERAGEWTVDPARVGIMGSSAGGHLAATLLTHFDTGNASAADPVERQSSRPDFGILCYPVITMGASTHGGSRENLLGRNPPASLIDELSNEKHVRTDTPPCFIWHTADDPVVSVENSLAFAAALRAQHVPFDLHIYQTGRHGLGLGQSAADPARLHPWTDDLLYWLSENKLIRRP